MNRHQNDDVFQQQLWEEHATDVTFTSSSNQESHHTRHMMDTGGSSSIRNTRIQRLKKWHSSNALPVKALPSPCLPLDSESRSYDSDPCLGSLPIIEEEEDDDSRRRKALSRWESGLPSLSVTPVGSGNLADCPTRMVTQRKHNRPQPPRRQKSIESIEMNHG